MKGVDRQTRSDQSTTIPPPPPSPLQSEISWWYNARNELNGARRRVSRKEIAHFRHGTIDIIDKALDERAAR